MVEKLTRGSPPKHPKRLANRYLSRFSIQVEFHEFSHSVADSGELRYSQFLKRSSVVKRFRPISYWRFTFEWRVRLEFSVSSCAKSGEQVLTE